MINIPLDADVVCTDGKCGKSLTVIIDPTGPEVTHFVVEVKDLKTDKERLVPVEYAEEADSKSISLSCTTEEVAAMEPFIETRYIGDQWQTPGYWYSLNDIYMTPYAAPVEPLVTQEIVERVPAGKVAVHRGAWVEATDGHVGKVGELVIDPESRIITHFTVRGGHLWGKKEVTLPVTAIDRSEADTIYLKLDKDAVKKLPSMPLKRSYDKAKAAGSTIDLVARVFDNPEQADEALRFVQDLQRQRAIKLRNAAVVVKDKDGETRIKDARDVEAGHGRIAGAIAGGLVGLVAGPVGVIVGALVGAGAGGLAAKWIDMGFSDKFLNGLQEQMVPGSSALVIVVEEQWAATLSDSLSDLKGIVFRQELSDGMVQKLMEESEKAD